ncbi:MAG: DUF615 domain-containing protein [Gammaproteobacteria bacterium]|nr:DUF615 domain-containing protein [Gammaproteobacteria bacterium]
MDQELSKSAKKREALRLQQIGSALTKLNTDQLAAMPIDTRLMDAIALYHRIKSNEAKRRQLQYIGRLMRDSNVTAIEDEIDRLSGESAAARYQFHRLERWRERLLAEPDALTEYLVEYPTTDRQHLKHLIHRTNDAKDATQQRKLARELFRLLRGTVGDVD